MENFIKNLKISNFKSIKKAELECGRINLFVGKPNVGKSNVLEGLGLAGWQFAKDEKFFGESIRYDKLSNLFFYQNIHEDIELKTDQWQVNLRHNFEKNNFDYLFKKRHTTWAEKTGSFEFLDSLSIEISLSEGGQFLKGEFQTDSGAPVKKYSFKENSTISKRGKGFLNPPFGDNLFWVLQTTKKLKDEIPGLFEEYGLEFLVDIEENKFAVQRKEAGIAYKIPYHLIADTLQRIIFHYAAIFSNKDSVILFEEPESHSFPPYIRELALKIVESTENQFFITTHSPHLFTTIVEETEPEDLAVFITYFENYETKFKKLGTDDINDLLSYGVDIFFNQKWFLNEEDVENPA